jgi:mannose-P-dolichol utilization defect protein 1
LSILIFLGIISIFTKSYALEYQISKILGWAIVLGSILARVPQILKIQESKSVEGLAVSGYYLEMIMMIGTASFSFANNIPFSVYGDAIFLLIQNLVIVNQIWFYNIEILYVEKLFVSVFMIVILLILYEGSVVDHEFWEVVLLVSMILNLLSKMPQIYSNIKMKSTGQMATSSFVLAWVLSIARLFTVLVESDDFAFHVQNVLAVALTTTLCIQLLILPKDPRRDKTFAEHHVIIN